MFTIDQWFWVILLSVLGSILPEVLNFCELRKVPVEKWPDYYGRYSFWILTILKVLVCGGLAPIVLGIRPEDKPPLQLIIATGASAPLLVARALSIVPRQGPIPTDIDGLSQKISDVVVSEVEH